MDNKTVFVRTVKGEDEAHGKGGHLHGDIKRALLMIDGKATMEELSKRAAPSLRTILHELIVELERLGLIENKFKPKATPKPQTASAPKMAMPAGMIVPPKKPAAGKPSGDSLEELDFTGVFRAPTPEEMAAEAAKAQAENLKKEQEVKARAEAEARARKEAEAARLKAQQEVEAARVKAEQEAIKARKEAEAAKLKAQQEAEAAKLKAAQIAAKAKEEAELAKRKADEEARARAEAEQRAKQQAEARAHAEARARQEIEAARQKAQQEAEEARKKAEQEAARMREEAEKARRQAEEEVARAREEAERIKRLAAEAQAKIEAEARARAEAEEKLRQEQEAVRLKAEQEAQARAEAERLKAEQEAKARAEAERLKAEQEARARAEAERLKAEQEAKAQAEAERLKTEQEAKARAEAERLKAEQEARAQAEAERLKTEQEAKARAEAERLKAEQEAKARAEAERLQAEQAASAKRADSGGTKRSTSATVLFFDVVGYTKQPVNRQIKIKKQFNQLLSECLAELGDDERIILDTGDGAAVGFLHHPEDALQVARKFREALIANRHQDFPDLDVRTGIHLGPVSIVKDMNGQSNLVGDGINDAQRVMSFAGVDQIFISRPYYDFISRLSDEYAALFQYRGEKKDKHGREHAVYELVEAGAAEQAAPVVQPPMEAIKLEPFVLSAPELSVPSAMPDIETKVHPEPIEELVIPSMPSATPIEPPVASEVVREKAAASEKAEPREETKPLEKRMPTEAEVAAAAAEQAKVWSEAEKRAAEEKEKRAALAAAEAEPKPEPPAARARRKPLPWGMIGAGLFVLAVAALFVVPMVMPMQERAAMIERLLTEELKQPVHIGKLSGRLLPTPQLVLNAVSVGEKQAEIESVRVDFAFASVFSENKAINALALEKLRVKGDALQQLPNWLQGVAGSSRYPVSSVELSEAMLEADGYTLSKINGALGFGADGKFKQGKLSADDGKYAMELAPSGDGKLKVSVTLRNTAPPLFPDWVFDDVRANGELSRDGLVVADFDGSALDGRIQGDGRLSWSDGWQASGNLIAKAITLQKIASSVSGDMDGTAKFGMRADTLAKLPGSAKLDGTFTATKGIIEGFDMVESARMHSKESQPGGRTHFDELSGELAVGEGRYHFRQLRMKAGMLGATGAFTVEDHALSGHVNADISMRSGMGTVGFQIVGTPENPALRAR